jgi:hypothetical protein
MVSMDSNITKTQETGDYNSKNSNFDNPKIRKTEQSTVNTKQKAGKPGHFTVFSFRFCILNKKLSKTNRYTGNHRSVFRFLFSTFKN